MVKFAPSSALCVAWAMTGGGGQGSTNRAGAENSDLVIVPDRGAHVTRQKAVTPEAMRVWQRAQPKGPSGTGMALSILHLNPQVPVLTWLTAGDSGHPTAIGLALGFTAAPQHIARVALEGDVGPRMVHSSLSSSHFSILNIGACAGDHWE